MKKNCIFITIFNNINYVNMLYKLLESINVFGNLSVQTDILIYTTTEFASTIKASKFFSNKIKLEINDDKNSVVEACKARLDLFKLESVKFYDKILYLDTDILIKKDLEPIFEVISDEILYVLEEGLINDNSDSWGKTLFGSEIQLYEDKSAFTSGILLFKNCEKIKWLFNKISEDMISRPYTFGCIDQPYFVYNSFRFQLYNNKVLKKYVANHNYDGFNEIIIHHFPGIPGKYDDKLRIMTEFLEYLRRVHNK